MIAHVPKLIRPIKEEGKRHLRVDIILKRICDRIFQKFT